jgi:ACR3 family arsenite efflux pump ArsB
MLLPEDRAAKIAPEEFRRRQLAAMTGWILAAAARTQAVVLAFEDLHWADPTSLASALTFLHGLDPERPSQLIR